MSAQRISAAEARARVTAGATVLDVRTPQEYAAGHVAGARNVPIELLANLLDELPDGALITTCMSGGRGGRAADLLAAAGREAYSLDGGTAAWRSAGLPVSTGDTP